MRTTLISLACCAVLALAGCSSSGDSTSTDEASDVAPTNATVTVDVTISGDKVTPNGDRVEAQVGEPVTLHITSDRAGELHVHSDPEQQIEYGKGETTTQVTVDSPGVIDVEDHIAGVVVVQLEVS